GWNEAALLSAYRQGLDPLICAQVSIYDDTVGLENIMLLASLSDCQPPEATNQLAAPLKWMRPPPELGLLSQQFGEPPRLQPCAYYSKKLPPVEQNYDIRNRELLAIKLALEEWRHWLEGANHPFTVTINNHKNLQYLRDAKRLNPCQARWALFFTRFNFITYRPRNRNLPRLHSPDTTAKPETILPPALIVSPIQWDISEDIRAATITEPAPLGGLEGSTYVPTSQ
ncbi:hypothetical protein M9458_021013, partial [Cirrhinus mrigala]